MSYLAAATGCNQSTSGTEGTGRSSSSSSGSNANVEVTLSGKSGVAHVGNDRIELKDGTVFVNGVSHGPVPSNSVVKFTTDASGPVLFVGQERRTAQR